MIVSQHQLYPYMSRFAITYPGIPKFYDKCSIVQGTGMSQCPRVLGLPQVSTILPISQSPDTGIIQDIFHCTGSHSVPIPLSWDTPDISHCTGSHSVPLSFPSHSPGILGFFRTEPTVLGLTRSHYPGILGLFRT